MKQKLIFKDLARYYDLICQNKDYKKEADEIDSLIKKYKKSSGNELLDAACGTGKHLSYLSKKYNCTGFDLNEGILNIAKENVKDVKFVKADMTNFNFHKEYDIITCLFSSIGYAKTYSKLEKTIQNFSNHLKKGGVLIIEPWFTNEAFEDGHKSFDHYENNKVKIDRAIVSEKKGNISILNMNYSIAEKGKDVKYYKDKHEFGLFEIDETMKIMKDAGLKVKYLKKGLIGRGLYIGVKV